MSLKSASVLPFVLIVLALLIVCGVIPFVGTEDEEQVRDIAVARGRYYVISLNKDVFWVASEYDVDDDNLQKSDELLPHQRLVIPKGRYLMITTDGCGEFRVFSQYDLTELDPEYWTLVDGAGYVAGADWRMIDDTMSYASTSF